MTLGSFLKEKRMERGLGLREFAKMAGFSFSYYNDIEKDRRMPADKKLVAIIKALDLKDDDMRKLCDYAMHGTLPVPLDVRLCINQSNLSPLLRSYQDLEVTAKELLSFVHFVILKRRIKRIFNLFKFW